MEKKTLLFALIIILVLAALIVILFKPPTAESTGTTELTGITPPHVTNTYPSRLFGNFTTEFSSSFSLEFSVPVTGVREEDLTVNGFPATKVTGNGIGLYVFTGYPIPDFGKVDVILSSGNIKRDSPAQSAFEGKSLPFFFFDPNADDDGDGLLNKDEITKFFSDPTKTDTDDDNLPDWYEVENKCLSVWRDEALPQDNYGVITPGNDDADSDGATNLEEFEQGTDPCVYDGDFEIKEEHKTCVVDEDCVTVQLSCGSCFCGGVNKLHLEQYNNQLNCENYEGILCYYECTNEVYNCINTKCQKAEKIIYNKVDWEESIRILNSGEVEFVSQTHNLDVYLVLKDRTAIKTKEPVIDLIFDEVEKCGEPCKDIELETE